MNDMIWLTNWYKQQCDSDWEHSYGIQILTLDNPGWRLSVCLQETNLETKKFNNFEVERSKDDWIHCFIKDQCFEAACGVDNLVEAIRIFRKWAES